MFPANAGRGYVLRRILRRAVRHAWLLGRREPTLVLVVAAVIESMSDVYPGLEEAREHLLSTTRAEEDRFLSTIEGGLARFDELAPKAVTRGESEAVISGADAFKLYDTFGFPLDLTELMAEERGYGVDVQGFENALEGQRERSRADRVQSALELSGDLVEGWQTLRRRVNSGSPATINSSPQRTCWPSGSRRMAWPSKLPKIRSTSRAEDRSPIPAAWRETDGRPKSAMWRESVIEWRCSGRFRRERSRRLRRLRCTSGRSWIRSLGGTLRGITPPPTSSMRRFGEFSAVTWYNEVRSWPPDRLRFDFSHTAPMTENERREVEEIVSEHIWEDHPLSIGLRAYDDAVRDGATALFGEKYDDVVRVVEMPGVSMELCGGTHVGHTGEIGLFKITSESGVAAGVRRIEGITGRRALQNLEEGVGRLDEVAAVLGTSPENTAARAEQLLAEKKELEGLLDELRSGGGAGESVVLEDAISIDDVSTEYRAVRLRARNADDARKWGDKFLKEETSGVAVVSADLPEGKHTLFAFVTDDLIGRGVRADAIVREIASVVGGRGVGDLIWLRRASRIPNASTRRSERGETWWRSSLVKLRADGLRFGLGCHSDASRTGRVEGLV